MSWHAQLQLNHTLESGRTVARHLHQGPLRILQSLYPEGDAVCHNVLIHPPGGLVGGDTLDLRVCVGPGAHGLVTTPGATRFYKSDGPAASQQLHAQVAENARLEWLPLETIAYNACQGSNRSRFELAPGAELIAWDVTALGLPASDQAFSQGQLTQSMAIADVWLEKGHIRGQDSQWLNSPLGLAGHKCLATMVFAAGTAIAPARVEAALDATRALLEAHPLRLQAGVTLAHPQVIVLRTVSPLVEPSMQLLKQVWACWRHTLWQLPSIAPRMWAV
jgi:urease accessory protein